MFVKDGFLFNRMSLRIKINDILWIKGLGNYSILILKNGRTYTSSRTLKVFELLLKEHDFIRPSKFSLVNLAYVIMPSKTPVSILQLKPTLEKIPVSRRRHAEIANLLLQYNS